MTLPFDLHGKIYYNKPNELDSIANKFGKKRTEANSKLHEVAPEYSRGKIGDAVDFLGLQAELIADAFLKKSDVEYNFVDIFGERPEKTADVFIDSQKIDVKGVRTDLKELRVNCKAHFDKDVTHYWFIKPLGKDENNIMGIAEYWIIPAEYITFWKKDSSKKTPFFFEYITEINKKFFNEK